MKPSENKVNFSRRDFLKSATISAAAISATPYILTSHAAADDPIRIGLIGCGGRGMGAVGNALSAGTNVELVAIADLFPEKVEAARKTFESGAQGNANWAKGTESTESKNGPIKLDPAKCFSGFDAYKKLIQIPEINYVILTTPPGFRPFHFKAAVEAGKNCFIEKPVAVDGPGVRMVMEAGKLAKEKKLGVLAGTQRRHSKDYLETMKRIHDGAVGDIVAARAYWNQGSNKPFEKRKPDWTDMEWQLRNWLYYTWLSGDIIAEQHLHNIDVINWAMKAHPIKAYGMGGRQVRTESEYGHVYDHFCVEFIYASGARSTTMCRQIESCSDLIGEEVVGTKGTSNCKTIITGENKFRLPSGKFRNPYEQEHVDFIESIRAGNPLNEAQQVAESNLTAIMGRESAYSGKMIDWDTALESTFTQMPKELTFGPLPTPAVAMPGKYVFE